MWNDSSLAAECTFHQLAPYVGKMKPAMARALIETYSEPGDRILDPFSGSGAIPLESIIAGREVVCADINPYAVTLTRAKLAAPDCLENALKRADHSVERSLRTYSHIDLRRVPRWVRSFFHPRTLRETIAFADLARGGRDYFSMAALLGILHHERPGFLSYPASHLVPYLRSRKYPRNRFPEMYEYRALRPRLAAKIRRAYKRPPMLGSSVRAVCMQCDARSLQLERDSIDAIITSPPYMDALDYARDNRLRLWFLGVGEHERYERNFGSVSGFSGLMSGFLRRAQGWLVNKRYCVLVIGDLNQKRKSIDIAHLAIDIATKQVGGFKLESLVTDRIPAIRRSRRGTSRTETESVVVLRRMGK